MSNFLIDGVWILKTYSGICLFEEIYDEDLKRESITKDLITGFLTAIVSFAEEAFKDDIKHIKFSNHRIILEYTEHIIFVIAVSIPKIYMNREIKEAFKHQINQTIERIVFKFNEKFGAIFKEKNWDGAVKIFLKFSEDLKEIIPDYRKPLSVKLISLEKTLRKTKDRTDRRLRRQAELKRLS